MCMGYGSFEILLFVLDKLRCASWEKRALMDFNFTLLFIKHVKSVEYFTVYTVGAVMIENTMFYLRYCSKV